MKQAALFIVLVLTFSLSAYGVETIPANDPNIQYTGRIDFSNPLAPVMTWPGNYIEVNFEGTSINVKMDNFGDGNDDNGDPAYKKIIYFAAVIDDGAEVVLDFPPGSYTRTAASGLADTTHKLLLWKRSEHYDGTIAFTGFELDDGKTLLPPPSRPQRRIEFFGDSVTVGLALDSIGDDQGNQFTNNYLAYSSQTARNLNAEIHTQAISGIGLVGGWGQMSDHYDKLNPRTGSSWDFDQWVPHVIVQNLGHNDLWFATPSGAEALQGFVNYVSMYREAYGPDVHIIISMINMNPSWVGYIETAVSALNTNGDPKVYSCIYPDPGIGTHPHLPEHTAMAIQLTDFINNSIPNPWLGSVDMNGDKIVNLADFGKFGLRWLDTDCDLCYGADLSGDNVVDVNDLKIMANNWMTDFSLRGHWKLDGDATDSSWYELSSTVTGSVWDPNGRIDGAVKLDGIDDKIKADDYKGVLGGQSRTTCAWIKTSQALAEIVTWGEYNINGARWVMRINSSGVLNVQVGGGTISGSSVLTDGAWHHVAAVLDNDGSPNLNEVKLYVDGTEEAVPVTSVAISTSYANVVKIGVYGSTANYFNGWLDDVRIYDRPLSQAEIDELFSMGQ